MRGTIHLVTARDCLALRPAHAVLLDRARRALRRRRLAGADSAGRCRRRSRCWPSSRAPAPSSARCCAALARARPAPSPTRADLARARPGAAARRCGAQSGQATWATTEAWLGGRSPATRRSTTWSCATSPPSARPPSRTSRTWCGLTRLREVFERLARAPHLPRRARPRPLDLPDAPLPDPDTPAPPRFLPEYDNLLLSHADRTRVFPGLGPGGPLPRGGTKGALLMDGFYRAFWSLRVEDGSCRRSTIGGFKRQDSDPRDVVEQVEAGGHRACPGAAGAGSAQRRRRDTRRCPESPGAAARPGRRSTSDQSSPGSSERISGCAAGVVVRRGVAVGRVVAAAHVAALEADAQVQPLRPGGQAVLAALDRLGQLESVGRVSRWVQGGIGCLEVVAVPDGFFPGL